MKLFLFLAFVLTLVAAYELVVAWAFRVVGEPDDPYSEAWFA